MDFLVNGKDASGFDYDLIVPRIKYKLKEKLYINGSKYNYSDIFKFVYKDKKYVPLICAEENHGGRVVSLLPEICIGLAEAIGVTAGADSPMLYEFCNSLLTGARINIDDGMIMCMGAQVLSKNEDPAFTQHFVALRTGYVHKSTPLVMKTARLLFALYCLDERKFTESLFNGMKCVYPYHILWLSDLDDMVIGRVEDGDFSAVDNGVFTEEVKHMGYYEYCAPGSRVRKRITDGRGFSIGIFINFLSHLYHNFGEILNKNTLDVSRSWSKNIAYLDNKLYGCLGNDWVSGVVQGEWTSPEYFGSESTVDLMFMDMIGTMADEDYQIGDPNEFDDGEVCNRDIYENAYLYSQAHGLSGVDHKKAHYMGYATIPDIQSALVYLICNNNEEDIKNMILTHGRTFVDSEEVQKLKDEITGLRQDLQGAKNQCDALKDRYIQETESLREETGNLKFQLDSKNDLINKLYAKLEDYKTEFGKMFGDQNDFVEPDEVEDEISEAEMVDYINNFKFLMIGGRSGLLGTLEKSGFTNVYQVERLKEFDSSVKDVDFICINTKFCSHKLCYMMRKRYEKSQDAIFYYNGVNASQLIKTCYMFAKNYMEG